MTTKPYLKELLKVKLVMDEVDKLRLGYLRRKAGEHTPTEARTKIGRTSAGTVASAEYYNEMMNRASRASLHDSFFQTRPPFTLTSGFQRDEPPKDWAFELEMVQHALVSRDRAVVHIPRASSGWSLHTTLERAFEARFGNSAYVNHGFPVNWPNDNCVYVPIRLDHLVRISVPRVVAQGTDTRAWPRVVVFAYTDDEHFHVGDLP